MYIVCVVVIMLCVLLLIRSFAHLGDAEKVRRNEKFLETSDKLTSLYWNDSIKKVKDGVTTLDVAYNQAQDVLNEAGNSIYKEDRAALVEHLHDLEEAKWEKKADKYLQEFSDCYFIITSGEFDNFRDVDMLFKTKNRCIALWQKYFAIDLSEYETTIYPKRYLREWMGEDYDLCMESHDALEKKLSECVNTMRPEYKRKTALYEVIVDYVYSRGSLARSELLKHKFDGYIPDEVKCCYNALIKNNRLVEIKLDGRFFVSLSDKESAKEHPKTRKSAEKKGEQKMIAHSNKLVHDAIIKHLMDEGVEYIDMTHKGGGLYFFSESIAEDLKSKGYNIGYAENGSRSTGGKPAWYLKK